MSEGLLLAVLFNALLTLLIVAAAGGALFWWQRRENQRLAHDCEFRHESLQIAILDRSPAAHVHTYADADHQHPHDHPHNHEHIQHTHTLETMSKHEENGRPVFVKYCGVCKTVFRDLPEPQAV